MRCRFCYETGHNVKGCKKMKETAAIAAAKPYEDRSYNERYAMAKVEHHKQANKTRTCSYCGDSSHTRRTCQPLAKHIDVRNTLETRWRKGVAKAITESPIKIGALVEWTTWQGCKVTAIITGLNTEKMFESKFGVFSIVSYGSGTGRGWIDYTILSVSGNKDNYWGPKEGQIYSESLPTRINDQLIFKVNPFGKEEESYGTMVNIISEGTISFEFPEKWIHGADASEHMKDVKRVHIGGVDDKHDDLSQALQNIGF